MTVGPDGQQPIDDDDNATVGPDGPTPNIDRRLPSEPETGKKPIEDKPQVTIGPDDQTLNLDHSFDRSLPPGSQTRKKRTETNAKENDQTLDFQETKKQAASKTPKSVLETEHWIAKQPEATLPSGPSGAAHESSPDTADDAFDRTYPIGRYEVRRLLGQGAFGRVYEAHDPQLDRRVAVKVSKELKGRDEVNRFLREARSAAHLRHPTIIPVFEYGQIDDLSMIVYELVDGETLRSYIKRNEPLELSDSISIIRKIAEGLDYAHKQGIIHRDVKPDNILMDKQGEPHIADFGCARRSDDQDMHQTMEGSILGTPMYMSPEQASGQAHQADGRSDVWSLGVMLYEMVSGQKPFKGKLSDLLHLIRHHDAKPLRKVHPSTPRDIETICGRCLHRDLDKRFATAGELADELRRFERGEPILSRRISLLNRTWLWAKRNRAVASLLTAVAVTLLAGTTFSTYFAIKAFIAQKARARVSLEQLATAESSSLDNILVDLEESKNSILATIREKLADPELHEHERRRLTLGQLYLEKDNEKKRTDLFNDTSIRDDLLSADGYELISFCDAFADSEKVELRDRLWEISLDSSETNDHRLRAACALAQIDPQSEKWEEKNVAGDVTGYLTAMNLVEVPQWLKAVEPIRQKIKPKLKEKFAETRSLDDASPETAAVILSYMLKDYDPDVDGNGKLSSEEKDWADTELDELVDLVPVADARQLAHLMTVLEMRAFSDRAKDRLIERLQRNPAIGSELVTEKANLILALIRMEYPEAWQKLKRSTDNSVSTEVIERLAPASTSVDLLLKKIDELKATGSNPDALAAVLLALGQFTEGQIPQTRREDICRKQLVKIFQNHGDARVHSSARWLMTKWGFEENVGVLEKALRRELPENGKNWHVDLSGNTFVLFEPDDFDLGIDWPKRSNHRFGICIHEVTVEQFKPFLEERKRKNNPLKAATELDEQERLVLKGTYNRYNALYLDNGMDEFTDSVTNPTVDPGNPVINLDFFMALEFCRWLTDKEHLEPSLRATIARLERFYRDGGRDRDGMGYDAINLNNDGYRLPTANEWEFACRAGTNTTLSLGIQDWASQYAWYRSNSENSTHPLARLKPNEAGLFDMLGNASEWCLDWYYQGNKRTHEREFRGGSYQRELIDLGTSKRWSKHSKFGQDYLGFRLARTYPPRKQDTPVTHEQQ